MGISFRLVTPQEQSEQGEDYDEGGCRCGEKAVFNLDVDMGGVSLACHACGLPPEYPDWEQAICLDGISVQLSVEREDCTCRMRDQLSCDCNEYLVATPVPVEKEKET